MKTVRMVDGNISDDQKDLIANFGALNYDNKRMSILLDVAESEINDLMKDNTEFHRIYMKGRYMSEYLIEVKLFEMAKSGDIKAIDKLRFIKSKR